MIAARPLRQYATQRLHIAQCLRRCCHRREKRSHDRRLLPNLSRRLIKLLRILIVIQHLLPFRQPLERVVAVAFFVECRLRVVLCIRPHLISVQFLPAVLPEQILVFLTQVPDRLLCPGQHALAVDLRLALLQRVDLVLQLRHALPIFRKPGPGEMRVRLFDLQRLNLLVQLLRRPPHPAHLIPLHGLRRFCTPVLRIHVPPHLLRGRRKPAGQQCALSLQRQRPKLQPLRRLHAAQIILVRSVLLLHARRPAVFLLRNLPVGLRPRILRLLLSARPALQRGPRLDLRKLRLPHGVLVCHKRCILLMQRIVYGRLRALRVLPVVRVRQAVLARDLDLLLVQRDSSAAIGEGSLLRAGSLSAADALCNPLLFLCQCDSSHAALRYRCRRYVAP